MSDFIQLVIAGLATGSIYALAAIGFTLLWQTSQTINFAQGEFVMIPVFAALVAMNRFGFPFWLSCLFAIALSMLLLGFVFKIVIVDPLLNKGTTLPLVISTLALAIFPHIASNCATT
jgi:branched-chain amino acid transport system permease protein